ncbi:MAG TPA: D-alanine--D-alanine ligase [Candidatus Omnitrophota bacterium]|nr:D-alanine--D-alanine ligase [Candidatus Omnitrophota bacterium]
MIKMTEEQLSRVLEKHVGVLMGGCSSEKEISIKSGTGVVKALTEAGCRVSSLEISTENPADIITLVKASKIDIAFIALHGRFGEDGRIQEILDSIQIPYTGSDAAASRTAMDKLSTYQLLRENHVRVPSFLAFNRSDEKKIKEEVRSVFAGKPVVVKPVSEGSSFGVTIVADHQQLSLAVQDAFSYGDQILIEAYIHGKELTAGILGNTLLPVVEIRPKNPFFDYKAKYQAGMTEYIVPAEIDPVIAQQVQQIAWRVHRSIGCRHLSRVDLLLDENNIPWVLEINTIPGMTATSLLPKAASAIGIDFKNLCLNLVRLAYEPEN